MKHEVGTLGRRVDLNLMVVFDAIHRTRNLTSAGKGLGLSQPAMSHALSRLRWLFDDRLFVRAPGGLQPTPFADEIAPAMREGLATIRAGFERKRFDPASSSRIFTLAMGDLSEFNHLPLLLRAMQPAPGLRVRAVALDPAQRRAALAAGEVDLALGNDPAERPLCSDLIGEHGYKTVVRAGHPDIRGKLSLAAFSKARHVLVRPVGGAKHGEVIEAALRNPKVNAEVAAEVGSFFAIGGIVPATDLVATVTPGIARAVARMARVQVFDPPVALPRARIYLWWHERHDRDPGNRWLRELYLRVSRPLYA